MSLPQQKKSAEEIAKLRENLGIHGHPPQGGELPGEMPAPLPEPAAAAVNPMPVSAPAVVPAAAIPVNSPPRSEPVPVLAVEISGPPPDEEIIHQPAPAPVEQPVAAPVQAPRQVRSLRKSEQGPVPKPHVPPAGSPLPVHRHNDREIKTIRRNEALAPHAHIPHPQTLTAHPVVYVPGYLLAIAGAVCCFYYDLALLYPAVCEGLALLIAAFIVFKKPLSRHHGAFIAVMALLVIVFGALHYFPNLKYGT